MSPEPFDSRAKAPPAKRWEKGYGDENGMADHSVGAWYELHGGEATQGRFVLTTTAFDVDSFF